MDTSCSQLFFRDNQIYSNKMSIVKRKMQAAIANTVMLEVLESERYAKIVA